MMRKAYHDQVAFLLDVLPLVGEEKDLALKGGTAINLFERDLPRLSVDIDLTWLKVGERDADLEGIASALKRMKSAIEKAYPDVRCRPSGKSGAPAAKLICDRGGTQIKIEVNTVLRGHLQPVRLMSCRDRVQDEFGKFVEAQVVAHGELYGGKICAALDRQHPRDLFDVCNLLEAEGLSEEVRLGFIAALVGHNRPMAELLNPNKQDRQEAFTQQFSGMAFEEFSYEDHQKTLLRLVEEIRKGLTENDRAFLLSFAACDPKWSLYPLPGLEGLAGTKWKQHNLIKLKAEQSDRWKANLILLEEAFKN